MPMYVYLCDANEVSVEVFHGIADEIENWGELCERADLDPGDTPADTPVRRQIFAPAVHSVRGPAELKNLGFSKLVKRDSGVYENLTATDKASRIVDANE